MGLKAKVTFIREGTQTEPAMRMTRWPLTIRCSTEPQRTFTPFGHAIITFGEWEVSLSRGDMYCYHCSWCWAGKPVTEYYHKSLKRFCVSMEQAGMLLLRYIRTTSLGCSQQMMLRRAKTAIMKILWARPHFWGWQKNLEAFIMEYLGIISCTFSLTDCSCVLCITRHALV